MAETRAAAVNEIRKAIVSALDAVIITTMLAAGFLYVFRWPLVVMWAVAMLAKVL